ncbi:MAG: hypothetical protein D6744_04480 [Planctomycetota bacterium]|nr:MAG: hypothetical protein D6744_04480 [Planctomycetota bacterium]
MRFATAWTLTLPILISGCVIQPAADDADSLGAVLGASLSVLDGGSSAPAVAPGTTVSGGFAGGGEAALTVKHVSGQLAGELSYEMIPLGASNAGDEWIVRPDGRLAVPFVVALFDAEQNLIRRAYVSGNNGLRHVVRVDTPETYLGVMTPKGQSGGGFAFVASRYSGRSVPAPRRQIVWLNFQGASNLAVHTRAPISFGPFDATLINSAYAGQTQFMKDTIVAAMRHDYRAYDVTIISSDEAPRPTEPHSVIHFGGDVSGLLGLSDSVDDYNGDATQNAIIYVESFAPYHTMQLDAAEMAVMVANVASHELGHLLGLYHTADPVDVMDTTGTAWELAQDQDFARATLEHSVFATGWEDSPALLEQIVGLSDASGKTESFAKLRSISTYHLIREFAAEELVHGCGTCAAIDPSN